MLSVSYLLIIISLKLGLLPLPGNYWLRCPPPHRRCIRVELCVALSALAGVPLEKHLAGVDLPQVFGITPVLVGGGCVLSQQRGAGSVATL